MCNMNNARKITTELYRNDDCHEVWRILVNGQVKHENVASDHDMRWLVDQLRAAA